MTNKMAEAGADAALIVTPCFYKSGMTAEALEKHFTKVNCIDKNFPKLYFRVEVNSGGWANASVPIYRSVGTANQF